MDALERTDLVRIKANSTLDPKLKSSLGQYFTPRSVCLFMASLFKDISGKVKLLDPGCGPGSLTASFIDEALKRKQVTSITLTTYDVDPLIENYIKDTLELCEKVAMESNVKCETTFHLADFILSHRNSTLHSINTNPEGYSHVIINPPYKKIGAKSKHRLALQLLNIDTVNLYTGFLALSIRLYIYENRLPVYKKLRQYVDEIFQVNKKKRWHYESRIKQLESFCLKIETNRYENISEMEDFFGACLVVENSLSIDEALKIISGHFKVMYKRPKQSGFTHKSPDSFVFDDLRLYLIVPNSENKRPKGIEEIVFELQIKTFLQHAWSIATHDLIYKGDVKNWSNNRIAFQVKAMLEHAELSILESDSLSESSLLKKDSAAFKYRRNMLSFLKKNWTNDKLPTDLNRLVENVINLTNSLNINLKELKVITSQSVFFKNKPSNIDPFLTICISIIEANQAELEFKNPKNPISLFLPDEAIGLLPVKFQDKVAIYRKNVK